MLGDLPLISAIKGRMQYHQTRQKLLAENVANADSPGFKPRDLKPFDMMVAAESRAQAANSTPAVTHPAHIASAGSSSLGNRRANPFETTQSGNAVSLEDEMMRLSQNNSDYQLATTLYGKSLSYLRMALGKRG
jgi:flagellar basal-body rod protein FlgB